MVGLEKIGTYRGVGIYYSAEHDTYNAINDAGRWLADGCVTRSDAHELVDEDMRPIQPQSRVGRHDPDLWDTCPIEYLTERG